MTLFFHDRVLTKNIYIAEVSSINNILNRYHEIENVVTRDAYIIVTRCTLFFSKLLCFNLFIRQTIYIAANIVSHRILVNVCESQELIIYEPPASVVLYYRHAVRQLVWASIKCKNK